MKRSCASKLYWFLSVLISTTSAILTPGDIDFASKRCQNISTNDLSLRMKWSSWEFPNNHQTYCYIKCFLYKSGLINLESRGLDVDKIATIVIDHGIGSDESSEFLDDIYGNFSQPLSGTCESYYHEWMELYEKYKNFIERIFFVRLSDKKSFYKKNKEMARGEAVFEKYYGLSALNYCKLMKKRKLDFCYLECVFKHLHYFDAYGRVDKTEVVQSFHEALKYEVSDLEKIEFCVHTSNQLYNLGLCQVSKQLHRCLSAEINSYLCVIEIRDKLSKYF